jgi:hypothetical protein
MNGSLRSWWSQLGLWALYLAVAAWPVAVGAFRPGITGYERAMLPDMVYGRAHRPFVKRQLAPLVVRGLSAVAPRELRHRLTNAFEQSSITRRLDWPPQYATEFTLALGVMYVSMLGFLLVLCAFLSATLVLPGWLAHGATLATGLAVPIFFAGLTYIYDFPQLLLFTAALLAMARGRRWAYYPLLALACLNKETSILLPVVLALWLGRRALTPRWAAHLAAQFTIGLAIVAAIGWVFRNNPGGEAEFHLQRNLSGGWSTLGWVRLAFMAVLTAGALWGARRGSRFLRAGLAGTLAPLVAATLVLGYLDELRDYYEALPFIVALVLLAVCGRFGVKRREISPSGRCDSRQPPVQCNCQRRRSSHSPVIRATNATSSSV